MIQLTLLVIFQILSISFSHKCRHNFFQNKPLVGFGPKSVNKTNLLSANNEYHPIDIHVDFGSINALGLGDETLIKKYKKVTTIAAQSFTKFLSAKKSHNLAFTQEELSISCYEHLVASREVRNGIETDMLIIPIIVKEEVLGKGNVAAAGACGNETEEYRPILGIVFLGEKIDFSKTN